MTWVKPGMRQRAKRPKTHSACETCRRRRIKCDEGWPVCLKCVSSKRTCLGYRKDGPSGSGSSSSNRDSPPLRPALAYISSLPEEQRALQYFQEQSVADLCCYNGCELWDCIILQAAQTDDCIRHAVLALSSFHEIFTQHPSDGQPTTAFALRHYNSAIRHQIEASTGPIPKNEEADRHKTASILFVCIELLQDHYVSAFSILANATSAQPERKSSSWPRRTVERIYNRLQLQAFGLLGPSVATDMDIPGVAPPRYQAIPATFSSIDEARFALEDSICRFAFAQKRETKDILVRGVDLLEGSRMMMSCWSSAFQNLLNNLGSQLSRQDQQAVNILRIWELRPIGTLEATAASLHMYDPKQVWDRLGVLYNRVVCLAEEVVANADASLANRRRTFTLDHGIVSPMMSVALMCRDPDLRRRATDVLRCHTPREGLYDGELVRCVVKRAAQIEAAAAPDAKQPSDIPMSARIDSVVPTFRFGDRHAASCITRQNHALSNGTKEVFEEVVSWYTRFWAS